MEPQEDPLDDPTALLRGPTPERKRGLEALGAIVRSLLRHAVNPVAVVLLHLACRWVFGLYEKIPNLDTPMHFLGGVVIAQFFVRVVEDLRRPYGRGWLQDAMHLLLTLGAVSFAALAWEIVEFASDSFFGTQSQRDNADTMGDLIFGLLGGLTYWTLVRWKQAADDLAARRAH